jgi:hypothetical protein
MTAPITWAEATSPILWSNIGIDWNTPAKANSATFAANVGETHADEQGIGFAITFGANVGQTLTVVPTKPVSITMALTAAQAVGHDKTLAESAIFGADLTSPVTDRLDAVESITFAVSDVSTLTPGTTFTDEPIYAVSVAIAGSTSLLWNEEADVTTTWTKVDYPN